MTPTEEFIQLVDDRNGTELRKRIDTMVADGEAEYRTLLAAEEDRIRKLSKSRSKKRPKLPDDWVTDLRARLLGKYPVAELRNDLADRFVAARDRMIELAPLIPDGDLLAARREATKLGTASPERNQTQPDHYGEMRLLPELTWLRQLGFNAEVRRVVSSTHPTVVHFELWADCPKWVMHVVTCRSSIRDALLIWKQHAVQWRVYYPLIPYNDHYRDCEL